MSGEHLLTLNTIVVVIATVIMEYQCDQPHQETKAHLRTAKETNDNREISIDEVGITTFGKIRQPMICKL